MGNGFLTRSTRLALALLTLGAIVAWCQSSNGSVRGKVHDQTEAVIPGANVVLTNIDTNVELKTTTNNVGLYVFPSVIPGPYKVRVTFTSMDVFEATVTVRTQESATVDVTLFPVGIATVVKVEDVTPTVKVDSPDLGHTLEQTAIQELPINGRNVSNLLNTVPGMTGTRTYGVRQGTHDTILDGAPLTDELYGVMIGRQPGLESIQEFSVTNNASSAKFSRQTSIILTTKSGTNQLHGSLRPIGTIRSALREPGTTSPTPPLLTYETNLEARSVGPSIFQNSTTARIARFGLRPTKRTACVRARTSNLVYPPRP